MKESKVYIQPRGTKDTPEDRPKKNNQFAVLFYCVQKCIPAKSMKYVLANLKKTHIITTFFQVQVHVNSKMDFLNELARFDQLTCPCVEWTILAGTEGTGCFV